MESLAKGTNEKLYVTVLDRLQALTTLDGIAITWEVIGDENEPIQSGAATNDGMMVIVGPIDTSAVDFESDEYSLFITIALPPESIRLGPYPFVVN